MSVCTLALRNWLWDLSACMVSYSSGSVVTSPHLFATLSYCCDLQAHNGSLFPSAVVTLYGSYLCYSALQSEPHDYECNALGKHFTAASGSTLAIGMVIAIVSVVYSALRAGSNNRTFMSSREEAVEEGLLQTSEEGTSAGLDGEPEGQSMGTLLTVALLVLDASSLSTPCCPHARLLVVFTCLCSLECEQLAEGV